MKAWIWPLCLLTLPTLAQAQDYRIAWSPSSKQAAYLDDVKSPRASSWCAPSLPLRIVVQKKFDAEALASFLPAVGTLMHKECKSLRTLDWKAVDAKGKLQSHGKATRTNGWKAVAEQPVAPDVPVAKPAVTAKMPDTPPIGTFATPDNCHFRTYWNSPAAAQFFPSDQKNLHCDSQGWLNGSAVQSSSNSLFYLSGYPLLNLPAQSLKMPLKVTHADSQSLTLANTAASGSPLTLAFDKDLGGWRFSGTLPADWQTPSGNSSLKQ